MRKLDLPRYLRPTTWIRETGAFLLDFLFTFALGAILYLSLGRTVLYPSFGGYESMVRYDALCVEGGFGYFDENEQYVPYEVDSSKKGVELYSQYEMAEKVVWDYFVKGIGESEAFSFLDSDGFSSDAQPFSDEYRLDVRKWVYQEFFRISDDDPDCVWQIPVSEGDFDRMPVPREALRQKMSGEDKEEALSAYKTMFEVVVGIDADSDSLFERAGNHFLRQAPVVEAKKQHTIATYASLYPSIILSPLVFFALVPLLMKNGVTFGKRICHIALVSTSGYQAKPWQIALHYGFIILIFYLFLIPSAMIMFMVASLILVLDYMAMILTRYHQSVHSMIAHTLSLDSANSVWFASREAEDAYIAKHPQSFAAKLRKEKEEDAHKELVVKEAALREESGILDSSTLSLNPHASKEAEKDENAKS